MDLNKDFVIVRHEYIGSIIWSRKLDRYYLVDKDYQVDFNLVLARKNDGQSGDTIYVNLNDSFVKELKYLGFGGTIKEIKSDYKDCLSAPLDVYFDYTWNCNLQCSYCYNRDVSRNITMSKENITKVLSELAKNGVMRTHLAGGEPLINLETLEHYLSNADKLGMRVSVNCNGTIFSDDIADVLFGYNLVSLTFSLDGHTQNLHDYYRGKGCFERVIDNVKKAVMKKLEYDSLTRIQLKAVWSDYTPTEHILGLVDLAVELGADVMQFHNPERCVYHESSHYSNDKHIKGYYENAFYIRKLQSEYKDKIQIWNIWNPLVGCGEIGLPNSHGCIGGQELFTINPNGDMNPCLMNPYDFGNLFKDWDGDLSNFLKKSEKLKSFQNVVSKDDGQCSDCTFHPKCRGGSKTRVLVKNGYNPNDDVSLEALKGIDPLCPKDFIEKNPLGNWEVSCSDLTHFKAINVTHSL